MPSGNFNYVDFVKELHCYKSLMPYTFYMLCFLCFRVHQQFDFIFLLGSTTSTPPEALPNHRRTRGLLMGIYLPGYAHED